MSTSTAWIVLFIAGLFETGWAVGLKYTEGFTRLWPSVATVISMAISVGLLGLALKVLPVGTGYAVWVGIGAALTVAMGVILFSEPVTAGRVLSIALIIAGIIGLKLTSA